ncbi:MAG: transcriptional regulator [Saprospiraceae bacterium]|nr:transcriptional regulator [Saprospiraceae bacterium]
MLRPIKSEEQYESYLEQAYRLMQMDLKPNSKEADDLELLSILIENYEKDHYPMDPPHPIEAILFRLDQMNMNKTELTKILGSRSRTSEILSGKRKLSLGMIRKLNELLGIPAEVLIRDYKVEHA